MKELEYPFDSRLIMAKKKNLRRKLLENKDNFNEIKVAILGGYTTRDIRLVLELFLLNNGIKAEFYESEYNKFYEDAIFDNPELVSFHPDIIYICTSNRNIEKYPNIEDSLEQIDAMIENEYNKYYSIWEAIESKYHCPIIQNNFELPYYRTLGNRDAYDMHGKVNYITRLNMQFYQRAEQDNYLYLCDINYLSADYGLSEWSDPFYYYMYKYALNVNAIPYLAYNVANIIKSLYGKNKKGIVLDLDNTLWGGIIGEDGPNGIRIGEEDPEGQMFSEFQRYIKEQSSLGVVLCVNSKNDIDVAISGLRHPSSILKEEDFAIIKANWEQKDKNIKDIASELNLGADSLVFIDDNPAERHIVENQIGGIGVPYLGEPHRYLHDIDRAGFFEVTEVSKDDKKRSQMYRENIKRENERALYKNYNDYLLALDMKSVIREFEPVYFARITQLTNKSNQFNLTTKRYLQSEVEAISKDEKYITLYGKLEDRFGDNGVVSVIIGRIDKNECHINLWLMSCRVLKRDMEYAMLDQLVSKCKAHSITKIHGYYFPTSKNEMVRDFYGACGFTKISEDEQGNAEWILEINGYIQKNSVIEVLDR